MASEIVQLDQGTKVERWTIQKKLGEGAFGAVYKVSDPTGEYALKVEGVAEQIQLLKMEVLVLTELAKSGGRHFCKIEDRGRHGNFNFVVMTLVGKSLQDLRKEAPNQHFSMGTAISIGIQCLESLEDLHDIGYLHRDVKPGNFTIGRVELKEQRKVYILDFGMCRKYVHDDGTIKKPRTVAGFRGTIKYAPIACHLQRDLCRGDDIETWVYMIVEFVKGRLPWRNLTDMHQIGDYKKRCRVPPSNKELFGGCPREFPEILGFCDRLKYFDAPNYQTIYNMMRKAINSLGIQEFPYDWENPAFGKTGDEKVEPKTEGQKTVGAKTEGQQTEGQKPDGQKPDGQKAAV